MIWWWSWLLSGVGVVSLWLAGSGRKVGWVVGIASQVLWLLYAVATRQWGFLVSVLAFGTVYVRNWVRWNREERISRQLAAACGIRGVEDECYDS